MGGLRRELFDLELLEESGDAVVDFGGQAGEGRRRRKHCGSWVSVGQEGGSARLEEV